MSDIVDVLAELAQHDIDAVFAYEQVLKNIDDSEIYNKIDKFRANYIRHINEINNLILSYGGKPLEKVQDFKGYMMEGFTSLRSITGIKGALRALQSNEMNTIKKYQLAIDKHLDFPPDVLNLIQHNHQEAERHLGYIQEALDAVPV